MLKYYFWSVSDKINPNKGEMVMYKNWKAICQIPDAHVMWALALLDMDSDLGRKFVERFPEYFTSEQQAGPIPLSVLRMLAEKDGREQGAEYFDALSSFDKYWRKKFDIPEYCFSSVPDNSFDDPMLPAEIDKQIDELGRRAETGDVFTWEGKQLVLLENNDHERGGCCLMHFAPAELIVINK